MYNKIIETYKYKTQKIEYIIKTKNRNKWKQKNKKPKKLSIKVTNIQKWKNRYLMINEFFKKSSFQQQANPTNNTQHTKYNPKLN